MPSVNVGELLAVARLDDRMTPAMGKLGSGISKFGLAAAGSLAGVAIAAGRMGTRFESAAATAIQATGKTGEEADALRDSLQALAGSVPGVKLEEFGDILGNVDTHFGLTGAAAEKMAIAIAQSGADSGNLSVLLKRLGRDTEGSMLAIDQLTAATQKYGGDVNVLTQSLGRNAARFDELGLSVEDQLALGVKLLAQWGPTGLRQGISETIQNMETGATVSIPSLTEALGDVAGVTAETHAEAATLRDKLDAVKETVAGQIGPYGELIGVVGSAGSAMLGLASVGPVFSAVGAAARFMWAGILGPVGLVAGGIAAIAAIGFAVNKLGANVEGLKEAADEATGSMDDMYGTMSDSGLSETTDETEAATESVTALGESTELAEEAAAVYTETLAIQTAAHVGAGVATAGQVDALLDLQKQQQKQWKEKQALLRLEYRADRRQAEQRNQYVDDAIRGMDDQLSATLRLLDERKAAREDVWRHNRELLSRELADERSAAEQRNQYVVASYQNMGDQLTGLLDTLEQQGRDSALSFVEGFNIADSLRNAFQHTGDSGVFARFGTDSGAAMGGSIVDWMGSNLGSDMERELSQKLGTAGKTIGFAIGGEMGAAIGQKIGAALPGIANTLSSLVQRFLGAITGGRYTLEDTRRRFPNAGKGGPDNGQTEEELEEETLEELMNPSGRAMGGPVSRGVPYWVGERGPEIVVPRQAGTVIPAGQVAQLANGQPIEVSVQIDGAEVARAVTEHMRDVADRAGF